ncbi:unnamed protein product [Litomosoides sigmodontis]|uniref:Uncharacterized protein n=1 Tax=Litomosoides sigmodontis TaxID=42156 RepID=A0A3P7K3D0_LITSI|nr:unnamed protein product [Litomosoides sigmodontis]
MEKDFKRVKAAEMDIKRKKPHDDMTKSLNAGSTCDILSFFRSLDPVNVKPKRVRFELDVLKADLEAKYLCLFPEKFFTFWKHVEMLAGKDGDPCGVYGNLKSLRLCGVFDYLSGHFKDENADKFLLHDRFATDLPEMQTLAVYDNGRFVYWRDEPNTEKPLIVHVDNAEHFPKCFIIGAVDPFYIIAHLVGRNLPAKYRGFFTKDWIENYATFVTDGKAIAKARKQSTVGQPFHGIGICVKVVNNVGYRPLNEKTGKLKELINESILTNDEIIKRKKLDRMLEIFAAVQFANDEKDFGMGLEFGHNVFWCNYAFYDKMALKILTTAYKLLKREAFARILNVHMQFRRGINS